MREVCESRWWSGFGVLRPALTTVYVSLVKRAEQKYCLGWGLGLGLGFYLGRGGGVVYGDFYKFE